MSGDGGGLAAPVAFICNQQIGRVGNKMKNFARMAMLLCGFLILVPSLASAVAPGDVVADFELAQFGSDKPFKLSAMKGKGVVFGFVQSACASCRAEIKFLNSFADSDKFNVYQINVDAIAGTERWNEIIKTRMEKSGWKMGILMDPDYTVPKLFGVRATPGLAVIDKDGKLVGTMTGFSPSDQDTIKEWIDKID